MRSERRRAWLAGLTAACLLGAPATASAQLQCVIDYNGDGFATTADIPFFFAFFTAGSGLADLNADGVVDPFDFNTAAAYFGFTPCPGFIDYQYNRVIDPIDLLFFNLVFSIGSLRADVNGDGFVTPADQGIMNGLFSATY